MLAQMSVLISAVVPTHADVRSVEIGQVFVYCIVGIVDRLWGSHILGLLVVGSSTMVCFAESALIECLVCWLNGVLLFPNE